MLYQVVIMISLCYPNYLIQWCWLDNVTKCNLYLIVPFPKQCFLRGWMNEWKKSVLQIKSLSDLPGSEKFDVFYARKCKNRNGDACLSIARKQGFFKKCVCFKFCWNVVSRVPLLHSSLLKQDHFLNHWPYIVFVSAEIFY